MKTLKKCNCSSEYIYKYLLYKAEQSNKVIDATFDEQHFGSFVIKFDKDIIIFDNKDRSITFEKRKIFKYSETCTFKNEYSLKKNLYEILYN